MFYDETMVNHHQTIIWDNIFGILFQAFCANPSCLNGFLQVLCRISEPLTVARGWMNLERATLKYLVSIGRFQIITQKICASPFPSISTLVV